MTDNPLIKIYVNKIENRGTFNIKTGNYLKFLTSETWILPESPKNKIAEDENGENVPHLENNEVVIVHCNFINNDYQHDSRVLYTFVHKKSFVNYWISCLKVSYFRKPLFENFHILKYGLLIKILNR